MGNSPNTFLLSGRWVILSADDVRPYTALFVEAGRIKQVGPTEAMRAKYPDLADLGGANRLVIPGLINAHHHCFGIELSHQGIVDDFLEPWMFAAVGAVPVSTPISTSYSAMRLLKSGVTSVVDMCSTGRSVPDAERRLSQKASAYRKAGLRAFIAPGERWRNRIVHGEGEERAFLETLPRDLRKRLLTLGAQRRRLSPNDYISCILNLAGTNDGMTSYWFGPTGPQWTPDDVMTRIGHAAEKVDTRIQTHALESHYESIESSRIRNCSTLEHLDKLGVLNGRLSLAHMVWCDESEFEFLRKRAVQVSINPSSNLRLRSGIAPAAGLHKAGVGLAIGMDGTTLAEDEDMFAEMRLALNLNRPPHPTATALTVKKVFHMATEGGAHLLGRKNDLGRLNEGYQADAVVLDFDALAGWWCAPDIDPIELVLSKATRHHIEDVFVAGERVVKSREVIGIDHDGLRDQMRAELAVGHSTHQGNSLSRELTPYLNTWYARWDDDAHDAYPPVLRYAARPRSDGFPV